METTTMTTHNDAHDALDGLQRELRRLGWHANLYAAIPHPFLHVHAEREFIFVAWADEPHYTWSNTTRSHPLQDPAGAARRIAADLAARRRPTHRDDPHRLGWCAGCRCAYPCPGTVQQGEAVDLSAWDRA